MISKKEEIRLKRLIADIEGVCKKVWLNRMPIEELRNSLSSLLEIEFAVGFEK